MPDVVLSDGIVGGGVINTTLDASTLEISGSQISVSTSIDSTRVWLIGEHIYLRLRVRWNGSANDATVLEVWPTDWTPEVDVYVLYVGSSNSCEFKVLIDAYSSGTKSLKLLPESAAEVKSLQVTGFYAFPGAAGYQQIGFIPKDDSGDAFLPSDGDECWLTVIFS